MNEAKKKTMAKKGTLIAVSILTIGVLVFGPSLLAKSRNTVQAETTETPVFSVRTQEAERQTLRAFLNVNGDIVSTQQVEVHADVAGRLISVNVVLGTYVHAGDLIAEVDPSRPGGTFMNSPVYAPISGYITRTPLAVGTTISPITGITTISSNGTFEISARIPEREIAGLAPGLSAEVFLQAYPGETFQASVSRVSPVLDSASRSQRIDLSFGPQTNGMNNGRIKPGMFASIRINTRSYPNVLTVPAEAVVSNRGVESVFVVSQNEAGNPVAERRVVNAGVTLQGWTEIRSGISEGETIVVQGQQILSGGEQLRIIGSFAGATALAGSVAQGGN